MQIKIYYETSLNSDFDFIVLEQVEPSDIFEALAVAFCELLDLDRGNYKIETIYEENNLTFCKLDLCQIYTVGYGDQWLDLFIPSILTAYTNYI